jgi:hypothetical protein
MICADEDHPAIEASLDHIFDIICRWGSRSNPALVRMKLPIGQPKTAAVAVTHGFRTTADQPNATHILQKVCLGRCLTKANWDLTRGQLKSLAGLILPITIPEYRDPTQSIEITAPSGEIVSIALEDLETLLSPVLVMLPGRSGAIVPIRAKFAADLLGSSPQLSLIECHEARFLKERIYFSDPRTFPILQHGTPILFYESGKGLGRRSVIAAARVVRTELVSKESAVREFLNRGVLEERTVKRIGKSALVAATTFDNLMIFARPVSLGRLRQLGFDDPAQLVTARSISEKIFTSVLAEGEPSV